MVDAPDSSVHSGRPEGPGVEQWQRLVRADTEYFAARQAMFQARHALLMSGADLMPLLRQALQNPFERGAALHLLEALGDDARRAAFPELVDLASFSHGMIQLVRDLVLSIDRSWLEAHLPQEIQAVLQRSSTYEEYRRFAELLQQAHSPYLATLLARAAGSKDPDIRELADDFQQDASQ